MSILGKIGKIGLMAAPIAAAPVTGGISLTSLPGILGTAGRLAPVLSGAAAARGAAQTTNDQLGLNRAMVDLARRKSNVDLPGERLHQTKSAALMARFQPTEFSFAPGSHNASFTGGFNNPNLYTGEPTQEANDLIHKNLVAQLSGADQMGELPAVGKSNALDKILGIAGLTTSIMGALQNPDGSGKVGSTPGAYDPSVFRNIKFGPSFNPAMSTQ